jgi:hypothetical protein
MKIEDNQGKTFAFTTKAGRVLWLGRLGVSITINFALLLACIGLFVSERHPHVLATFVALIAFGVVTVLSMFSLGFGPSKRREGVIFEVPKQYWGVSGYLMLSMSFLLIPLAIYTVVTLSVWASSNGIANPLGMSIPESVVALAIVIYVLAESIFLILLTWGTLRGSHIKGLLGERNSRDRSFPRSLEERRSSE